jgi:hypothetical protein
MHTTRAGMKTERAKTGGRGNLRLVDDAPVGIAALRRQQTQNTSADVFFLLMLTETVTLLIALRSVDAVRIVLVDVWRDHVPAT